MSTEQTAREYLRIKSAMTSLLITEPFFGPLALRLEVKPDESIKTCCTDGTVLLYNPKFISGLTGAEIKGLLAHEVLHCANGHPWRREGREASRWNKACDYAINCDLLEAGFELPSGGCIDAAYKGLSAEAVYCKLPEEKDEEEGDDPGGNGGVDDPKEPGEEGQDAQGEQDWKAATEQASMQAQKAGKSPAFMDRLVRSLRIEDCRDLITAILEWASRACRNDYSWKRPNPRYTPHGLYLPILGGVSTPPIMAAVDTSGSVSPELLGRYTDALQRVLEECKPESMVVYSCDARIQKSVCYQEGDLIEGNFPGGGGTDFRPVFEAIDREEDELISGLVYLTDLEGSFPTEAPPYPVLWVVYDPRSTRARAPFGETLWIS